jgi:hypothetical protein
MDSFSFKPLYGNGLRRFRLRTRILGARGQSCFQILNPPHLRTYIPFHQRHEIAFCLYLTKNKTLYTKLSRKAYFLIAEVQNFPRATEPYNPFGVTQRKLLAKYPWTLAPQRS